MKSLEKSFKSNPSAPQLQVDRPVGILLLSLEAGLSKNLRDGGTEFWQQR
jgi:hypothetical protein